MKKKELKKAYEKYLELLRSDRKLKRTCEKRKEELAKARRRIRLLSEVGKKRRVALSAARAEVGKLRRELEAEKAKPQEEIAKLHEYINNLNRDLYRIRVRFQAAQDVFKSDDPKRLKEVLFDFSKDVPEKPCCSGCPDCVGIDPPSHKEVLRLSESRRIELYKANRTIEELRECIETYKASTRLEP